MLVEEVIRTPDGILISQRHYVLSMFFKFVMADCKSVSTPLNRTVKLCPNSRKVCDPKRFRLIVESLLYLTITRLDLSYPVNLISQFTHRQKRSTFSARNAYLGISVALRTKAAISGRYCRKVVGYMDTDWSGNTGDRRSTSGFALSLGSTAWTSKKQPIVALSSTEVEHRGSAVATCETIWLKRLPKDLQGGGV